MHLFLFVSGNAVLLIVFAVIGHDKQKSNRGGLELYNILQIIFSIEFVLCVPGILWYLGMVFSHLMLSVHFNSCYFHHVHGQFHASGVRIQVFKKKLDLKLYPVLRR